MIYDNMQEYQISGEDKDSTDDQKQKINSSMFLFLSLLAIILTKTLTDKDPQVFQWLIGPISPFVVILVASGIGLVSLNILERQFGFELVQNTDKKGLLTVFVLTTMFGLIIASIDTVFPFPVDTNVLFPQSLLFYPVVAFVAEIIFHVVPLALALVVLSALFKNTDKQKLIWIGLVLVALIDPLFQLFSGSTGMFGIWASLLVTLHIFLFNLTEVSMFKQYDFITMLMFRLMYYSYWHIIWGYFRLSILF